MSAGASRHLHRRTPNPRPQSGWEYWAAVVPALAAIIGFGGVYSYVWAPADTALFAAMAVYLWRRALAGRRLRSHALLIPMAGFGLLVVLQWSLHLSVYPGATLTELIKLAGCGAAFYIALAAFRRPGNIQRLGWLLWLFTGLLAAEAVLQAFGANGYIYWFHNATYGNPVGPFVYHNFYAGCMDLLLPIAVVYSFRGQGSGEPRWALLLRRALIPAVGVGSVVISQSRGGILIIFAEAILGVLVFWPDMKGARGGRLYLAAGGAMLLGFTFLANWGPVSRRFESITAHDPSVVDRIAVARSCIHIFLDHPWTGTGFGTFTGVYPAYQTFDSGLIFVYAHNDYAQTLAETGILGALCVLGFFAIWAWCFWQRRVSQQDSGTVRNLQLAFFIGTAGFLAHSYGDFQFHAPGNALLFFLLVAAAVARPRAAKTTPSPNGAGAQPPALRASSANAAHTARRWVPAP